MDILSFILGMSIVVVIAVAVVAVIAFVKVNKNWNNDAQYLSSLGVGSNHDAS